MSGNISQELVDLENELYEIHKELKDTRPLSDDVAAALRYRQSETINEIQAIEDSLKLHSVNVNGKSMFGRFL